MSAMNHIAKMRPEVVAHLNAQTVADGGKPIAWSQDVHEHFPQWLESDDFVGTYLASWWPRRAEPNVLFVH